LARALWAKPAGAAIGTSRSIWIRLSPTLALLGELVGAGFEPVDLVILNEAVPLLAYEAVWPNQVIFRRPGFDLGSYVSRVIREYWDLEPLLRIQRIALKRRWLSDPA